MMHQYSSSTFVIDNIETHLRTDDKLGLAAVPCPRHAPAGLESTVGAAVDWGTSV
jgi:hypothetical protein